MPCIRNVSGVRPLPFFIRASGFKLRTTGNGTGTNVLKWNRALEFELSIQSSVHESTTAAKVSLFSTGYGLL